MIAWNLFWEHGFVGCFIHSSIAREVYFGNMDLLVVLYIHWLPEIYEYTVNFCRRHRRGSVVDMPQIVQ
ncbi:hypothetical protein BHE74_00037896 [Ensete ventricosum]|nr:hypothetical protein GW17_00012343 [Ensete ventricosum]RWW55472.1 hypothetical protein BHE74_00037896 [Ensete ventricosum]RZS14086.1 hypothetical protein BHM03_00045753 [Ensete ventricosum]